MDPDRIALLVMLMEDAEKHIAKHPNGSMSAAFFDAGQRYVLIVESGEKGTLWPGDEDWWRVRLSAAHSAACDAENPDYKAEPWLRLSDYDISLMAKELARRESE